MKQVALLILPILFYFGCASTPTDRILKDYPALGRADGSKSTLQWTKFDGFDFLVFYGQLAGDASAGAGVYQGGDPKFKVPHGAEPIKGRLGIFDVNWYALSDKDSKFYRTCLIDYQKTTARRGEKLVTYTTQRHVWAYAETEAGLNAVISELDQMKMFAVRLPDIFE